MSVQTEFEMTDEDLAALLDASKPTPAMWLSGGIPMYRTPQENANCAWGRLAEKMGFKQTTVQPVPGKGQKFFTAEPLAPRGAAGEEEDHGHE